MNSKNQILIKDKRLVGFQFANHKKWEEYTLSLIDSYGNVVKNFQHCKKMPSGYYIVDYNCFVIYDSNLNQINTHGIAVDYIDGVGYVSYILNGDKKKYGLWDFNGNNLVENKFDYYEKDNLKSYKFSYIKLLAEHIVETQELDFKSANISGFGNNEYFNLLLYKLKLEGVINNANTILIRDLNTLNKFINDKDNKVVFREFPCLIKEPEFYTKNIIIKNYIGEYQPYNCTYKEYIYDVIKKEIKPSDIKNKKNEDNKYFFYSDLAGKYKDLYKKIADNYSQVLEKDFNNIISLINNKFYDLPGCTRMMDNDIERSTHELRIKIKSFNEKKRKEENNQCYIATLVYQDIEHPKVEFLRNFRDDKLLSNYLGRIFVKLYYKTSPKLVTILKPYSKIQIIIRFTLDKLISILQQHSN